MSCRCGVLGLCRSLEDRIEGVWTLGDGGSLSSSGPLLPLCAMSPTTTRRPAISEKVRAEMREMPVAAEVGVGGGRVGKKMKITLAPTASQAAQMSSGGGG